MADTRNAHIRGVANNQQSNEVAASDAERLLRDPAFEKAHERVREDLVKTIEDHKSSGTEADEDLLLECCRELRVLRKIRSRLVAAVNGQRLKDKMAPDSLGSE